MSETTNRNGLTLRLSHHQTLAGQVSGAPAALFIADARNGVVKVSIMLEEIALPLRGASGSTSTRTTRRRRNFSRSIRTEKIPAIIDPDGPRRPGPLPLFESGAILQYLAEKTGQLLPADPARALADHPVAAFPDGRGSGRCSARSASFTNSPVRTSPTSGRWSAMSPKPKRLPRRGRGPAFDAAMDHGRRLHHRGYFDARLGAQSDRVLWRRGISSPSTISSTSPLWLERGLARPAVQRGLDIPKRP